VVRANNINGSIEEKIMSRLNKIKERHPNLATLIDNGISLA